MKVLSVNIGKRKIVSWRGKDVETGIFKYPVDKSIFLGKEDVENDAVVDRKYHGGIDKAVYGYSFEHYDYFKKLHPDLDWNYGMFGENITFSRLNEDEITVGSIYKLGECKLEVSKPRQPCYKLGIRFNTPKIVKQFWNSSKSGIYFKVLETGNVKVDDELVLLNKLLDASTIAEVYETKK
ncbi:MOSC domain-containing protein [Urechidicola croceus]|uniref:Sulfurase n=1 Tax=Urechidicola croceus TaxID=1850246 RepID=A0A1D8PA46_9FLAO|nr:MOSC domain-containing protein [Urechidicola croceus]AOW21381.1 sulfurase [Urechidicola croceus]